MRIFEGAVGSGGKIVVDGVVDGGVVVVELALGEDSNGFSKRSLGTSNTVGNNQSEETVRGDLLKPSIDIKLDGFNTPPTEALVVLVPFATGDSATGRGAAATLGGVACGGFLGAVAVVAAAAATAGGLVT